MGRNRFGPPNKPRPDASVAQAKTDEATDAAEAKNAGEVTDDTANDAAGTQADDNVTPDSSVVSDALPPNSDADSKTANDATHTDNVETPIASSTVRSWTADDVAAIPGVGKACKAYAHAHGTLASLSGAMVHLGAVFAATQEAEHRSLLTRAQRLHQDVAEMMSRRREWQGLGTLDDVAEAAGEKGG